MKKSRLEIYLSYCAVLLGAVFLRLVPHIPNVAPIAALALFSGVKMSNWKGFAVPLVVMIISDFFLGFHATVPFVYASFLLIVEIGHLLRKNTTPLSVGIGTLMGSILFFIVTNFGVWVTSSMYEKTIRGLLHCYVMGLPFFRNTLSGDIFYTVVFFLGYRIFSLLFVLMLPSAQKAERHVGNTV